MGLGPDFLAENGKVESGGEIGCEGRVRLFVRQENVEGRLKEL